MKIEVADIVRIFTFLLGSALQIAILVLMHKRKNRKSRESIFALFTFVVLCWTFGIFISLFSGYLYRGQNIVEKLFTGMAVFSFALMFPLFSHALFRFGEDSYLRIPICLRWLVYLLLYSPFLLFSIFTYQGDLLPILVSINFHLENFIEYFIPWALPILGIAWIIICWIRHKVIDDDERRCWQMLLFVVSAIIILYTITFILKAWHIPIIGVYLALLTEMLTFCLPPLMAYYLYFYNYMEYVFKRGLIFSVLGSAVITFYNSLIRPLGASMEQQFQINFRMIEGILVMLLVFFFDPVKLWLQEFFNWLFFAEKQYYRKIFSDLSSKIMRGYYLDLQNLLEEVVHTISQAMKIKDVALVVFQREHGRLNITDTTLDLTAQDIEPLVEYLEKQKFIVLDVYDFGEDNVELLREMKKIKAFTVIPAYNEDKLLGILTIGKRRIRHRLLAEEEEMLIMLLNQMVIAIENTRLVREKFLLERKMYENEKLSSLGRLSASIAHEVKNPLSSIKTIAQVTKEELPTDDPRQEGMELIIGEIDRLSRVVHQLLHFAKPHSGNIVHLVVSEVIQDVLLLLKHEAARNQVLIETKFEDQAVKLLVDRDALTEIFFNIIHNAIQALPRGGHVDIASSILYHEDHSKPVFIQVAISDNGPGIPTSDRQKIFEPFYTTKQTGTGLGLTIVLQRLQKLKGRIVVKDNVTGSKGITFEISFPVDLQEIMSLSKDG